MEIYKIKQYISNLPCIDKFRRTIFEFEFKRDVNKIRKMNKKLVLFMCTPCHGNLGDQAIVYAQYKIFEKVGMNECIIEVPSKHYMRNKDIIKKYINSSDLIVIDGGGNLGTLWPNEDDKISDIIKEFYKNKIIIFPETCYYDSSNDGVKRLEKNKIIYNQAKRLTVTLRDEKSFVFFEKNFPNVNKLYVPDIVLSIDNLKIDSIGKGCLLCFRNDLEKTISNQDIEELKCYLEDENIQYTQTSTVIKQNVNKKIRNEVLLSKWQEFAKAELVVTDRLHGMIFAAITGTPCLALDNSSKKVSGVYEWIRDHKYIKVCSNMDEVKQGISEMLELKNNNYKGYELKQFKQLIRVIKDE